MSVVKKVSINSRTFYNLKEDEASLASGNYFLATTADKGNFIGGPVSISSPFTSIRMGGMFKFNSLMACTIPSNIITPVPVLEHDMPVKEVAGYMIALKMIMSAI